MTDNGLAMQASLQESKLIPVIEAGRDIFSISGKVDIEEEVDSSFGIADVVFFNLNDKLVKERQDARIPAIRSLEILETFSIVNKIGQSKINITHLYNSLPYSEKTFKEKILNFLTENNIADNIDNTYLDFRYLYKNTVSEFIAIEAKISNWQRGLYQAYRYRQYADFSYLALHSNYVERAKQNIDLFKNLNVGLISVDEPNKRMQMIFKPKKETLSITDRVRYFACEEILMKRGLIQKVV